MVRHVTGSEEPLRGLEVRAGQASVATESGTGGGQHR